VEQNATAGVDELRMLWYLLRKTYWYCNMNQKPVFWRLHVPNVRYSRFTVAVGEHAAGCSIDTDSEPHDTRHRVFEQVVLQSPLGQSDSLLLHDTEATTAVQRTTLRS
jgi:hypothetical protein